MRISAAVRASIAAVVLFGATVSSSISVPAAGAATMTPQAELAALVDSQVGSAVGGARQTESLTTLAVLLPNPLIIHPDIAAQVDVDLSGISRIAGELAAARDAEALASSEANELRAQRSHLVVVQRETRSQLALDRAEENAAASALNRASEDLGFFALDTFLGSSALDLASFSAETGPSGVPTLSAAAEDVLVSVQRAATARLGLATGARLATEAQLADLANELVETNDGIDTADAARDAAAALAEELAPEFESALLSAPVVGVDFPVVVLDAYYRAALRTAENKAWCGVRWDQLAGIGKVESGHGTFGGNVVGSDGRTDGEILGPVLDGTKFASIPDTDGGRYDLDPTWDRAVGPMQFIPGSWVRFGEDGNGDGVTDPHNMYDAALAAANHLCGSRGGLDAPANYQQALLGYNRSTSYGLMVMDYASRYRSAVSLVPTATSVADPELAAEAG